ncbi:hypothetical protein Tco_0748326 [Tanacetum coccineum]|uniref:Uncharacterized protein n=1 Tax=Tanacetum coccineum TaxID=301880 RepID=A0ABQ4YW84_9ASTR
MSAFSNLKPIYSASVIIHSKSASGYDALADSTAKADPETSAPNDSLPPQHGKDEGTKNYSLDHIFACTNPNVLADKTKSVSDWLETVLTTPETGTRNAAKPSEEIRRNEEEGKNDEIHSTTNNETEDTSALPPPHPPSTPSPTVPFRFRAKGTPSKFNELTDEVKALKTHVHGLEIEVPGDLKSLPTKLEEFTTTVTNGQASPSQSEEQINQQKKIEEEAKAEAARREGEIRKEELIDLLGPKVVNKLDDTSEIIPEFKASDLTRLAELGIDLDRPLSKQDPLDRLNDLANKKRKHADDIPHETNLYDLIIAKGKF